MPKFPYQQWYPSDWLQDTRTLTPAEKGIWVDILAWIWLEGTAGRVTLSWGELARLTGCLETEIRDIVKSLETKKPGRVFHERNGDVTLVSRRIERDEKALESNKLRQRRHRVANKVTPRNADVTQMSRGRSQNPEARNQEEEARTCNPRDPRIASLQRMFFERLEARIGERPTGYNGGAAGRGFKTLLKGGYEVEEIDRRVARWFASSDRWIVQNQFRVELFFTHFNGLKNGPIIGGQNGAGAGVRSGVQPKDAEKYARAAAGRVPTLSQGGAV